MTKSYQKNFSTSPYYSMLSSVQDLNTLSPATSVGYCIGHLCPALSLTFSVVLLHVVQGLPASGSFWCPRHCSATIQSLSCPFLIMCSINFHLLLLTSLLRFSMSASSVLLCYDSVLAADLKYSSRESVLEDFDLIFATFVYRPCLAQPPTQRHSQARHAFLPSVRGEERVTSLRTSAQEAMSRSLSLKTFFVVTLTLCCCHGNVNKYKQVFKIGFVYLQKIWFLDTVYNLHAISM